MACWDYGDTGTTLQIHFRHSQLSMRKTKVIIFPPSAAARAATGQSSAARYQFKARGDQQVGLIFRAPT